MKQLMFFAIKEDLLGMLEIVDSKRSLKYARMGNFLKDDVKNGITVVDSGAGIPCLGKASADSSAACESFLVCEAGTPITLRLLNGASGERVCIDQLTNPDSVVFAPGGIWNDDVVLYGSIKSASESLVSQILMKQFRAAVKKCFTKVKAYYVGPRAFALLESGKRLTISTQSPIEFDLTLASA